MIFMIFSVCRLKKVVQTALFADQAQQVLPVGGFFQRLCACFYIFFRQPAVAPSDFFQAGDVQVLDVLHGLDE